MRTFEELQTRLTPYRAAHVIYEEGIGYLAWHFTTGENIELLFLEANPCLPFSVGQYLYRQFVQDVLRHSDKKPYNACIAYRLGSNKRAERLYKEMGWTQVDLGQSVYKGNSTVLMWIAWDDLVRNLFPEGITDVCTNRGKDSEQTT